MIRDAEKMYKATLFFLNRAYVLNDTVPVATQVRKLAAMRGTNKTRSPTYLIPLKNSSGIKIFDYSGISPKFDSQSKFKIFSVELIRIMMMQLI